MKLPERFIFSAIFESGDPNFHGSHEKYTITRNIIVIIEINNPIKNYTGICFTLTKLSGFVSSFKNLLV